MWKQTLRLPFRAPQDDFTPSNLEQVSDIVYFSLFDETVEDDSHRGGLLEGEETERTERRYLGIYFYSSCDHLINLLFFPPPFIC